jgi:putative MATE family efflux protein
MVHLLRRDGQDLEILLGEPKRAIRSMFVPFLLAFAIVEANQFIDTFWISGLGTSSASAISTIVPFYVLLMSAGMGISVGATTTVAFRIGRGEIRAAGQLASNALVMGVIASILASAILLLFLDSALDVLGVQSIKHECWDYMLPLILMSTPMICLLILGGNLRGEGAARKSTVIQITTALLNMVLDPLLIYVLDLGIMGAGLATGLASLIALGIGLSWYVRGRTLLRIDRSTLRIDRSIMYEMLSVGGPRTANELIASAMTFIQRIFFVVAGGTAAVMMYNYPWRFISLFCLPGKAFENSLIPVGSAAHGQGDTGKMWAAYMYCFKLTAIVSVAAMAVIFVFAEPLMSIMTYESSMHELLPKLVWCLTLSSIILPFMALRGVGAALLQAMKKAKIPMYFDLFWGSMRMVFYALSAYGFLGVDPFDGIIYIMVVMYSLSGVFMNALAVYQFRKLRSRVPSRFLSNNNI